MKDLVFLTYGFETPTQEIMDAGLSLDLYTVTGLK